MTRSALPVTPLLTHDKQIRLRPVPGKAYPDALDPSQRRAVYIDPFGNRVRGMKVTERALRAIRAGEALSDNGYAELVVRLSGGDVCVSLEVSDDQSTWTTLYEGSGADLTSALKDLASHLAAGAEAALARL